MKNDTPFNWSLSREVLFSDTADFTPEVIRRDKDGHYLPVKETIKQEELTIVNICATNIGAVSLIKQIY